MLACYVTNILLRYIRVQFFNCVLLLIVNDFELVSYLFFLRQMPVLHVLIFAAHCDILVLCHDVIGVLMLGCKHMLI